MYRRFPKSIRKFLRRKKAGIRRRSLELETQKEEIAGLYKKIKETGYNSKKGKKVESR